MDGIMPQLGVESTITALGKTWRVGRWTMEVWDLLLEMARPHLPDPFRGLDKLLPLVSAERGNELVNEALKMSRRVVSINSPEVQEWLETIEGKLSLLYALLREHHPDITRTQAMEICVEIGDLSLVANRSAGKAPEGNGQAPDACTSGAKLAALTGVSLSAS